MGGPAHSVGIPAVPECTQSAGCRRCEASLNGVEMDFSRSGKPTDNAFIEAFNGRFRQECLNENWFLSLADAEENVDPGEDTTMGKGPTVRWATCPLGSLPHWLKRRIDPQNSQLDWYRKRGRTTQL